MLVLCGVVFVFVCGGGVCYFMALSGMCCCVYVVDLFVVCVIVLYCWVVYGLVLGLCMHVLSVFVWWLCVVWCVYSCGCAVLLRIVYACVHITMNWYYMVLFYILFYGVALAGVVLSCGVGAGFVLPDCVLPRFGHTWHMLYYVCW